MSSSPRQGCGSVSGSCGCGASGGVNEGHAPFAAADVRASSGGDPLDALVASLNEQAARFAPGSVQPPQAALAAVNGVALHREGERPDRESLRQRACSELLRQAAQRSGDLEPGDEPGLDGELSEAATRGIETLLARVVGAEAPDEQACRRYFEQNRSLFASGERVALRHILFAVTPGVDIAALRRRAESALLDARCRADDGEARFPALARTLSNCPSGADGGELGWLEKSACAPEFAQEIFGHAEIGVLPRLVHSRFGLHVVEVLAREPGAVLPFAAVRAAVAQRLQQQRYVTSVRQYIQVLAAAAQLQGVDLDAAESPLVQ